MVSSKPNPVPPDESGIALRAEQHFASRLATIRGSTDRLFAGLLLLQWAVGMALALWYSPRAWSGQDNQTHVHVWAAVVLGGVLTALPFGLALAWPGATVTRYTVAVAQMLWSALLIHLSGGRIETHFHVFGSLAFLACYLDGGVLVVATIVIVVDHSLRGVFWPESVFGVAAANPARALEHGAWVAFDDVVLWISMRYVLRMLRGDARKQAALEEQACILESQARTLRQSAQELESYNLDLEFARRQLEQQAAALARQGENLSAANEIALQANLAKSAFLANMSHEIRTPMTAILGFADVLEGHVTQPEGQEALATIKRNGGYLLQIINDILDLSKIEAGKLEIERLRCPVQRLVADVASLMRVRAVAKGLPLEIEYLGAVPESIETDPTRLRQILINLVGNAIKFTEVGRVRLVIRCEQPDDKPARLCFDVIDTGLGMSREQVQRLFQPFTQADVSTTRRFGGTGLGLTISQRLAEMLAGGITVDSLPGQGSTFHLEVATGSLHGVPMLLNPSEVAGASRPDAERRSAVIRLSARLLLAEDGPDNQRLLVHVLKKAGAEVTVADNGKLAVAAAQSAQQSGRPFDAILMDMQMPVMDGYDATRTLRLAGYRGPIIALTAHAMSGDRDKCLAAGCDDYATKPIDREKLLALLAHYCPAAPRRDPQTPACETIAP